MPLFRGTFLRSNCKLSSVTGLKKFADGRYSLECIALTGLRLCVGFHFDVHHLGLWQITLYRGPGADAQASFQKFQKHLALTFGIPVQTDGESYEWRFDRVVLCHAIADHFGPVESVFLMRGLDPAQETKRTVAMP
jgi:hypothetical protein